MMRRIRIPQRFLVLSLLLPLALGHPGAAEEMSMTLPSFERAYRQALDDFAREQTTQAAAALADLENEGIRYISCIDLAQKRVHEKLPPAALLPVVMLRYAVFLEQIDRQQSAQTLRSKIVLQRLLADWVESTDTPEVRQAAARLLVPMAFTLDRLQWLPKSSQVRRLPRHGRLGRSSSSITWTPWRWLRHLGSESDAYLRWALELDPENVAAHHLRAFLAEEKERYDAAVTQLEALGRIAPHHGEARLRLGINLARVGRRDEAAVRLAEIAEGEQEQWLRIVATEELARLHAEAGRSTEAVALLRRARRSFPESAGLAIQLAQHLHQTEAPATITGELVDGWQGDRGPSPRARYATAPLDDLEANRLQVRQDIEQRLGTLADGLASLGTPERWRQIVLDVTLCEPGYRDDKRGELYLYHLVERFIAVHQLNSKPEKGRKWLYPPRQRPRVIDSSRRPGEGFGG
ncbi:MAG: hypothetical protein GY856_26775 [bacterium]|nr:hypothetical protein [bacterium]